MIADVVVDTNVWMHAANPKEIRMEVSVAFLQSLLAAKTAVCVDPGFDLNEAANGSRIWSEYRMIPAQSFAGMALAQIAASARIQEKSVTVSGAIGKLVNQMVSDRTDRVFVKTAANSQAQVLVSHDFVAFTANSRGGLRKGLGVDVLDAAEATGRL